jgi:serine/threonine-protein kinase
VADEENNLIREISPSGVVTTLAGSGTTGAFDGFGVNASFNLPAGIAVDKQGNIYVSDSGNNKIRKITPNGEVTTLAGSGDKGSANGGAKAASFNNPIGIAVDSSGNVYVADDGNYLIRKITQ